ncbi:hypothetical protein GUJ93_ZPchr0005g14536 [Zizania palustris]|nr:hypothetical protein GUJ93_ZPchr0005g14536 [Zizania palustris]
MWAWCRGRSSGRRTVPILRESATILVWMRSLPSLKERACACARRMLWAAMVSAGCCNITSTAFFHFGHTMSLEQAKKL